MDGVRGIAILLVMAAHTAASRTHLLNGGVLGVDVFFVLSGFLITTLLLEEWAASGRILIRGFYKRRARRLAPALVACLIAGATIAEARDEHPAAIIGSLVIRASYLSNVLITWAHGYGIGDYFGHLWSLAQEEQFYLLWPILLLTLLGNKPGIIIPILTVAITAVNIERVLLLIHGASHHRLWYAPDTHADPILIGCLAAMLYRKGWRPPQLLVQLAAAIGLAVVIWFRADIANEYPVAVPAISVCTALVILHATSQPRHYRVLAAAPLQLLGRWSYSLYLWHFPLILWLGPSGAVPAFLFAGISYQFIEQPFRRRRSARLERDESPSTATQTA